MQLPIKSEEPILDITMEERLAKVGAKIDNLIAKACGVRDELKEKVSELKEKEEAARKKGEEAFDEFKLGLDSAWDDLNEAWQDVKGGSERAAHKLKSQ